MPNDWWTGSPSAGLDRAIATGGLPPPGSLPPAAMNEYRMAAADNKDDIWNYDIQSGRKPPTRTRADVVAGWQGNAQAQAAQAQAAEQRGWQAQMASGLADLTRRKKKRGATAQDAGDALAGSSLA